jgi:carbonic anhydrase/acetyltransferase-like protein (isoleucine patch superfamily)
LIATGAVRGLFIRALIPVYLFVMFGVPTLIAAGPVLLARTPILRATFVVTAPIAFTVAFPVVCGLLCRLTKWSIVAGKFPRNLGHRLYGPRRLYSLCWTALYYFTPIYHIVLAIPLLKRATFRLFGYSGSMDMALNPDRWIRDLPLLNVADGAYLSNRATIGTNMCLVSGDVLVAPVIIGRRAMVGHLSMLAPGVILGDSVEISVGVGVGLNSRGGARSRIGPCVVVHHGVIIGDNCDIGATSYIGLKVIIGDGITIPAGTVVPPRTVLRSQAEANQLARSSARTTRGNARKKTGSSSRAVKRVRITELRVHRTAKRRMEISALSAWGFREVARNRPGESDKPRGHGGCDMSRKRH